MCIKLYLDTCRIQELVESTKLEYMPLKKHMIENKIRLVYSWINFSELVCRTDKEKIMKIASFISKSNPLFLLDNIQLFRREFISYNTNTKIMPFSEKIADSFLGFKDLSAYILSDQLSFDAIVDSYIQSTSKTKEAEKITDEMIKFWGDNNIKFRKSMSKDIYWKKVADKLNEQAVNRCVKYFAEEPQLLKKLSDPNGGIQLCFLPQMSWSYSIPFYTQFSKHANSSITWDKSAIWDIEHCTAVPFVDFFVTDKENHENLKQALKKLNFEKTKIFSNLSDLIINLDLTHV